MDRKVAALSRFILKKSLTRERRRAIMQTNPIETTAENEESTSPRSAQRAAGAAIAAVEGRRKFPQEQSR